jgi:hypothetical protein
MDLPLCPSPLPEDLNREIERMASFWARHPLRPRLARATVQSWDELVREWSEAGDVPLLVRKVSRGTLRGQVLRHDSGREIVPTDNSPASWLWLQAAAGKRMCLDDIRATLQRDELPVTMVVDGAMRDSEQVRYRCSRVSGPSTNALGWKLCHKHPVGLNGRGPLERRPIETLRAHLRTFLSPSNLFVVPLEIGGLGELTQFIEAIGREVDGL